MDSTSTMEKGCEADTITADECDQAWSAREDRLLRDLVAFRVPWGRIAIVLGNRPVEEVQKRWNYIRSGKPQNVEVAVDGTVSTNHRRSTEYTRTQPESKTERHVSFADPLVTAVDVCSSLLVSWETDKLTV